MAKSRTFYTSVSISECDGGFIITRYDENDCVRTTWEHAVECAHEHIKEAHKKWEKKRGEKKR